MKDFELLPHNRSAYDSLCRMLDEKGRAAVIQATGTGKGYIAMQLIKDNPDKHILFVTSYKANLTHFMTNLEEFSIPMANVTFTVYPSLACATENCPFDMVIADEFHRLGAPGFGEDFKAVLDRSPGARIAGFSATPVRHLDNQRDMAQELFNGDVAWELPLDDAILDGLLPAPDYITAAYTFEDDLAKAEKRLEDNGYSDNAKAKELVEKARRTLQNAGGLRKVFEDRLANRHGKYIVFCRNWEHMKTMMELADEWFGFCSERHVYRLYSDFRNHKDLDGFAADDSDALKLLFSIDMLNEGVHLAGIDGVIMLRPTQSPNVYFQQLGRALSVTSSKIPQVFDIVDNFAGMNVASSFWISLSQRARTEGKPFAGRFEVAASQIELVAIIGRLKEMEMSWDSWFGLACRYCQEHGSISDVGYDESIDGLGFGRWVCEQRRRKVVGRMPDEQVRKLDSIGMRWGESLEEQWEKTFNELIAYREEHGCLPPRKTSLGKWYQLNRRKLLKGVISAKRAGLLQPVVEEEEVRKKAHLDEVWNEKLDEVWSYLRHHAEGPEAWLDDGRQNPMYSWISYNRRALQNGRLEKNKAMKFADLLSEIKDDSWMTRYEELKRTLDEKGYIPSVGDDGKVTPLYAWFSRNRTKLRDGQLSNERASLFVRILDRTSFADAAPGRVFDSRWSERLANLKTFVGKHGRFPTRKEDKSAYEWLCDNRSRLNAGKLPPEREKAFRDVLAMVP